MATRRSQAESAGLHKGLIASPSAQSFLGCCCNLSLSDSFALGPRDYMPSGHSKGGAKMFNRRSRYPPDQHGNLSDLTSNHWQVGSITTNHGGSHDDKFTLVHAQRGVLLPASRIGHAEKLDVRKIYPIFEARADGPLSQGQIGCLASLRGMSRKDHTARLAEVRRASRSHIGSEPVMSRPRTHNTITRLHVRTTRHQRNPITRCYRIRQRA